jgi:hypothetical protein
VLRRFALTAFVIWLAVLAAGGWYVLAARM